MSANKFSCLMSSSDYDEEEEQMLDSSTPVIIDYSPLFDIDLTGRLIIDKSNVNSWRVKTEYVGKMFPKPRFIKLEKDIILPIPNIIQYVSQLTGAVKLYDVMFNISNVYKRTWNTKQTYELPINKKEINDIVNIKVSDQFKNICYKELDNNKYLFTSNKRPIDKYFNNWGSFDRFISYSNIRLFIPMVDISDFDFGKYDENFKDVINMEFTTAYFNFSRLLEIYNKLMFAYEKYKIDGNRKDFNKIKDDKNKTIAEKTRETRQFKDNILDNTDDKEIVLNILSNLFNSTEKGTLNYYLMLSVVGLRLSSVIKGLQKYSEITHFEQEQTNEDYKLYNEMCYDATNADYDKHINKLLSYGIDDFILVRVGIINAIKDYKNNKINIYQYDALYRKYILYYLLKHNETLSTKPTIINIKLFCNQIRCDNNKNLIFTQTEYETILKTNKNKELLKFIITEYMTELDALTFNRCYNAFLMYHFRRCPNDAGFVDKIIAEINIEEHIKDVSMFGNLLVYSMVFNSSEGYKKVREYEEKINTNSQSKRFIISSTYYNTYVLDPIIKYSDWANILKENINKDNIKIYDQFIKESYKELSDYYASINKRIPNIFKFRIMDYEDGLKNLSA